MYELVRNVTGASGDHGAWGVVGFVFAGGWLAVAAWLRLK